MTEVNLGVFNAKEVIEKFLHIKKHCVCCETWQERALAINGAPAGERGGLLDRFCADVCLICFDKSNGTITPEEDMAVVTFLILIWPPFKKEGVVDG